jgi:hypothetical protein
MPPWRRRPTIETTDRASDPPLLSLVVSSLKLCRMMRLGR